MKAVVVAMMVALMCAMPAEAGVLKKAVHLVKKTVMLPVYLVGGGITGSALAGVVWWHVGGNEGDLGRALSGQSLSK